MRRSACLLALLGMTVQNAVGDDAFQAGTAPQAGAPRTQQFFAAGGNVADAPQKFTRTKEAAPTGAAPGEELRKYYTELFGESAPADSAVQPAAGVQPASESVPQMTAAVDAAPAAEDQKAVVHAEFQQEPEAAGSIQQVRGERFGARPFPGARPTAPATPAAAPGKVSLTEPITVTPPAAQPAPATSAAAPSGTVTFSRPAVAATPKMAAAEATASPAITLTWKNQSEINVGQECSCQLVVKNSGQTAARDVEVRAMFPATVRLVAAQPAPQQSQSHLGWQLPELAAGEEKVFTVTMVPLQRGEISTQADVRFSGTAVGSFAVAEPLLAIKIDGPTRVMIGEPASHTVTLTNPGTGIASHVQVEAVIPEGLEHARGRKLLMDLGNLNPGESRSVRLALAATQGGTQQLQVQARADAGLMQASASTVEVVAPSLKAQIQGPGLRYLGRNGQYTLTVSNDGVAATDNVQVRYKVPAGFDFVSSDHGARFDPATRLVSWFVGRLEPGRNAEIRMTLAARQMGEFKHLVRATSEHGALSDAEFTTLVEGTSSLALEIKDLEDPVEVGSTMVYEVRVRNEGSAAAKAVGVSCELAPGMIFASAEGPADHIVEQEKVVFRSLPELAAGATATFKVKVTATQAGSLRLRAHLSSESIAEPLTAEELTKFYGE